MTQNNTPKNHPYEKAARLYCERTGLDPDKKRNIPTSGLTGVTKRVAIWELVAEELIDFSIKLTVLQEARAGKENGYDIK